MNKHTIITVLFVALCALALFGPRDGNCHTDWDGRSNPTVCE